MTKAQSVRAYTARLHERLYELSTTYTGIDPESVIEPFIQTVFSQDPEEVLKEVKSLLSNIKRLADSLDDVVLQYQIRIPGEKPISRTKAELNGVKDDVFKELGYYTSQLKSVESQLGPAAAVELDTKITTTFSVDTLAYFFRLLVDAEQVVQGKPKNRLYEKISTNFITKGATKISPDSVKNRFRNPDQKTLDDMVTLLQRLQTIAHQNQRNGVKRAKDEKKK